MGQVKVALDGLAAPARQDCKWLLASANFAVLAVPGEAPLRIGAGMALRRPEGRGIGGGYGLLTMGLGGRNIASDFKRVRAA